MMRKPSFDRWAFDNRHPLPVSQTTKISFEDYERMSTHSHKPSGERRLPTPEWAANDALLREVLIVFMERRAGIPQDPQLPLLERLERAKRSIAVQRCRKSEALDKLCRGYVELKRQGASPDRMRALEIQIENLDTYLRTTRNAGGADVVAAIVYLYYRAMLDSVGVGGALQIKPVHVRAILYRLNEIWRASFVRRKRVWRKKIATVTLDDHSLHVSARLAAKKFPPIRGNKCRAAD
jgi:hypothetical protein